jgi:hypothetical protein
MMEQSVKDHYIDLLRKSGYNAFPIAEMQKVADYRYKGSNTILNQPITEKENYGYIPILGTGNAIIDLDNKERYRKFAEHMISKGYMVIETGQGWHIPVTGLAGDISKIELFDYDFQPDKKIIEIQGPNHYCIGPACEIFHDKLNKDVTYQNKGSETIWNAKGKDFHNFIDELCEQCKVTSRKKDRKYNWNLRDRFLNDKPPTKGTSCDYFFQASLQCNTDELSQLQAIDKIKNVYEKWIETPGFSNRPWSNIENTINQVYEKNLTLKEGRPKGSTNGLDRTGIAQDIIASRKLFSDTETDELFENVNGFLEKITPSLKRELVTQYPQIEQADFNSILFKLVGLADPMPQTNKNQIKFRAGTWDISSKALIESEEIADMGFKDYDYLEPLEENKPIKFLKVMFDNVPKSEHPRINAGLRAILTNYLDPRISVIHGEPGTGKSTPLLILVKILKDYAMVTELEQLFADKFIRAKIKGVRLLVIQDLPPTFKEFSPLKAMTGEQVKQERGFMQDSTQFENKLKIWASGNYLAKIPEKEKSAMYSRRLSLIHNERLDPYPENPTFLDEIVNEEGEKIISWILNLTDEDCKYEDGKTVRKEWEGLASPEIKYLQDNYDIKDDATDHSIMKVIRHFEEVEQKTIDIPQMKKALESQGFIIKFNIIKNLVVKIKDKGQSEL